MFSEFPDFLSEIFRAGTMDAMTEAHLLLPIEACEALCAGIQAAMVQGLSTGPGQESDLKMLPSFVTNFPKGGEQGSFIALDLVSAAHRGPTLSLHHFAPTASPPSCRPDCSLRCGAQCTSSGLSAPRRQPGRPPSSDCPLSTILLAPSLRPRTAGSYGSSTSGSFTKSLDAAVLRGPGSQLCFPSLTRALSL